MITNLVQTSHNSSKKLLILDRDGTLIENIPYLKDKSKIEFKKGVIRGLRDAQDHDFELIIASNQSGIGRKIVTIDEVDTINFAISQMLFEVGVNLNQFIYCPHLPDFGCLCRKPKNGMIEKIIEDKRIRRNSVFLIGDMISDAEAAAQSNIRSFIVNEQVQRIKHLPEGTIIVANFSLAVEKIIEISKN
jgi:D-glycero-D-manno-heptose 1,7-bisphosphate phosphatase